MIEPLMVNYWVFWLGCLTFFSLECFAIYQFAKKYVRELQLENDFLNKENTNLRNKVCINIKEREFCDFQTG